MDVNIHISENIDKRNLNGMSAFDKLISKYAHNHT